MLTKEGPRPCEPLGLRREWLPMTWAAYQCKKAPQVDHPVALQWRATDRFGGGGSRASCLSASLVTLFRRSLWTGRRSWRRNLSLFQSMRCHYSGVIPAQRESANFPGIWLRCGWAESSLRVVNGCSEAYFSVAKMANQRCRATAEQGAPVGAGLSRFLRIQSQAVRLLASIMLLKPDQVDPTT